MTFFSSDTSPTQFQSLLFLVSYSLYKTTRAIFLIFFLLFKSFLCHTYWPPWTGRRCFLAVIKKKPSAPNFKGILVNSVSWILKITGQAAVANSLAVLSSLGGLYATVKMSCQVVISWQRTVLIFLWRKNFSGCKLLHQISRIQLNFPEGIN